jgi:hypothetical protein
MLTVPNTLGRRDLFHGTQRLCSVTGPDWRANLLAFAREHHRGHPSTDPTWDSILDAVTTLRLEAELATGAITADITTQEARP